MLLCSFCFFALTHFSEPGFWQVLYFLDQVRTFFATSRLFCSPSLSASFLKKFMCSYRLFSFSLLPCSSFFLLPISLDLHFFSPVHPFPFGNSLSSLPLDPRPRNGFKLALLEFASQQIVLACGTCLCEAPSCCSRSSGVTLKGSPLERGCRNCSPY